MYAMLQIFAASHCIAEAGLQAINTIKPYLQIKIPRIRMRATSIGSGKMNKTFEELAAGKDRWKGYLVPDKD